MKISVVLPTFGRATTIRAIQSINDQTFKDLEIIVVDDSDEQNLNFQNIEIYRTGGARGVSAARNLGKSKSTGDWIAFLDDDDFWSMNHLEYLLNFANETGADFVISSAKMIADKSVRPKILLRPNDDPFKLLYGKKHFGKSKSYLPTAGYLVRNKVAHQIKFDESLIDRENLDFVYQAYKKGALVAQSSHATLTVDYSAAHSLSRATLKSEMYWHSKLQKIDVKYSRNFKFESVRNFLRRHDVVNAAKMLFI